VWRSWLLRKKGLYRLLSVTIDSSTTLKELPEGESSSRVGAQATELYYVKNHISNTDI